MRYSGQLNEQFNNYPGPRTPIQQSQAANRQSQQFYFHNTQIRPSKQQPIQRKQNFSQNDQVESSNPGRLSNRVYNSFVQHGILQTQNNKENNKVLQTEPQRNDPCQIQIRDPQPSNLSNNSMIQGTDLEQIRSSDVWKSNYSYVYENLKLQMKDHKPIQIEDNQPPKFDDHKQMRLTIAEKEGQIIKLQQLLEFNETENKDLKMIIEQTKIKPQNQKISKLQLNEINDKENLIIDLSVSLCSTKAELQKSIQKLQSVQNKSDDQINKLFLISLENERLHSVIVEFEKKGQRSNSNRSIKDQSAQEIFKLKDANQYLENEIRRSKQQREGDPLLLRELQEQVQFYKSQAMRLNETLMERCRNY